MLNAWQIVKRGFLTDCSSLNDDVLQIPRAVSDCITSEGKALQSLAAWAAAQHGYCTLCKILINFLITGLQMATGQPAGSTGRALPKGGFLHARCPVTADAQLCRSCGATAPAPQSPDSRACSRCRCCMQRPLSRVVICQAPARSSRCRAAAGGRCVSSRRRARSSQPACAV